MTSAVANSTSAPSPGITSTFGAVPKLGSARRQPRIELDCRHRTARADESGEDRRVIAEAGADMDDVLARLRGGARDQQGMIGRLAVVELTFGQDADQNVRIEVDGIIAWGRHIPAEPAQDRPRARSQELLPRHRGESRLDALVGHAGRRHHMFRISTPHDIKLVLFHPQPCSASFLVMEADIWGSPPTHGSGSRNRALIARSRSRGGYQSVIRMAARGTANRTLPDDMGIATRSNVQLWPAPPGRSIGARSVASSSDSPLEQAGFELAVAFAQVSPRTRVASFKAPLSITRPLGNDA